MRRLAETSGARAARPEWALAFASGLLLGFIMCAMETIEQPVSNANLAAVAQFLSRAGPWWMAAGIAWAVFAQVAEPRLSIGPLALSTLLVALALSLVFLAPPPLRRMEQFDLSRPLDAEMPLLPLDARFGHFLWSNTFYGGLYMAAFAGARRVIRSRRALARVQQARDEAAALAEQSRLDAWRRQLQPKAIADALGALKSLYRSDAPRADALVDLLVGFLRQAVRSLGGETTTLAAELDLVARYLQLRSATGGQRALIQVQASEAAPEAPFPPRLMMPVAEHLCGCGGAVHLAAGWNEGAYRVALKAEGLTPSAAPARLLDRMTFFSSHEDWRLRGHAVAGDSSMTWVVSLEPGGDHEGEADT
jgi:hypothetical protein